MDIYPTDDADTRQLVRALTQYEDNTDELPRSELDTHIRLAKMRLQTQTDKSDFYKIDGLGQALVATTAILAKAAVENYSVDRWDLGVGTIDVGSAGDGDVVQFSEWASMAAEGLADAGLNSNTATNINSAGYIG